MLIKNRTDLYKKLSFLLIMATISSNAMCSSESYADENKNLIDDLKHFDAHMYYKKDSDGDGIIDEYDRNPDSWNVTDRDLRLFTELAYRSEEEITQIFSGNQEKIDWFNREKLKDACDVREVTKDWKFVKQINDNNGFSASIFSINGKAVLAFRGTDGASDVDDDIRLSMGLLPGQAYNAEAMYNHLSSYDEIYVTGHSLGGWLAQYYCATKGFTDHRYKHSAMFNSPGVALTFAKDIQRKGDKLLNTNYIEDSDSRHMYMERKSQPFKIKQDTVGGVNYMPNTILLDQVNSGSSHSSSGFFATKFNEDFNFWFSVGYRMDKPFLTLDTDKDGIYDVDELRIGTDNKKLDTDGDGFGDKVELAFKTNPKNSSSKPELSKFYVGSSNEDLEVDSADQITRSLIDEKCKVSLNSVFDDYKKQIPVVKNSQIKFLSDNYLDSWSEVPREGYILNIKPVYPDGSEGNEFTLRIVIKNNKTQEELNKEKDERELEEYKKEKISELNGLTYIGTEPKSNFEKNINNAKSKTEVDRILAEAKELDNKIKEEEARKLEEAKRQAIDEINSLKYLPQEKKDKYVSDINELDSAVDINNVVLSAKIEDENVKKEKELEEAKQKAIEEISALSKLSDSEKTDFCNRVNSATTTDEVLSIINEAKMKNDKNTQKEISEVKTSIKDEISKLQYIPSDEKNNILTSVDECNSIEDAYKVLESAKKKNDLYKSIKELNDYKEEQKKVVNNLENLTNEEKEDFNNKINLADSREKVDGIVTYARNKNQQNKLNLDKDNAKNRINGLKNITEDDKSRFCAEVDKANCIDGINKVLKDAIDLDSQNLKNRELELKNSKKEAKEVCNSLEYLTPSQLNDYKDDIDRATSVEAVKSILDSAKETNRINKEAFERELNLAKDSAKEEIAGLKFLHPEEADKYNKEINDSRSKDSIKDILNVAREVNERNRTNQLKRELDEYKTSKISELDGLTFLDHDLISNYKSRISDATTKDEVDSIFEEASNKNNEVRQEIEKRLSDAKKSAINEISNLEYLSSVEKEEYKGLINGKDSIVDINKVVETAKINNENKRAEAELNSEKKRAIDEIVGLEKLSQDEKDNFISEVNSASTKLQIFAILSKAKEQNALNAQKELSSVKEEVKHEISKLEYISSIEKNGINKRVDDCESIKEAYQILEAAKNKNENNRVLKQLSNYKSEQKNVIEGLDSLSNDDKEVYCNRIDRSRGKVSVDKIVTEAKNKNEQNKLKDYKEKSKSKINAFQNISNDDKKRFLDEIDRAGCIEDINNIVKSAANLDAYNLGYKELLDLNNAKKEAKETCDSLEYLTKEEVNKFKSQIDSAKNIVDVMSVVNKADERNRLNKEAFEEDLRLAKERAKETLNSMEYLSPSEKEGFVSDIDGAANKKELEDVLARANQINEKNKPKDESSKGEDKPKDESSKGEDESSKGEDKPKDESSKGEDKPKDESSKVENKPNNAEKRDEISTGNKKPLKETLKPVSKLIEKIKLDRISGSNRINTSIEVSKNKFKNADTVILVNEKQYSDALSSSVLAKILKSPVIFVGKNGVESSIYDEIKRLGAKNVILIGGENSISSSIVDDISKNGYGTERISGRDRYTTSLEILKRIIKSGGNKDNIVLSNGDKYTDILAMGSYASEKEYPILLVKNNSISKEIEKYLKNSNIKKAYIVGGKNSIDKSVEDSLSNKFKIDKINRISGENRYETAIKIAKEKYPKAKEMYVVSSENISDAVIIGGIAGMEETPILFLDKNTDINDLREYLKNSKISDMTIIGGNSTVSKSLVEELLNK